VVGCAQLLALWWYAVAWCVCVLCVPGMRRFDAGMWGRTSEGLPWFLACCRRVWLAVVEGFSLVVGGFRLRLSSRLCMIEIVRRAGLDGL